MKKNTKKLVTMSMAAMLALGGVVATPVFQSTTYAAENNNLAQVVTYNVAISKGQSIELSKVVNRKYLAKIDPSKVTINNPGVVAYILNQRKTDANIVGIKKGSTTLVFTQKDKGINPVMVVIHVTVK